MIELLSDLKFSLRALRRSPLFTGVAVLSLALGIGANTAIFTLLDQLLLRLLPVRDPGQLVMIWTSGMHWGSNRGSRASSYPIYQEFQQKAEAFNYIFCRYQTPLSIRHRHVSIAPQPTAAIWCRGDSRLRGAERSSS